MITRTLRNLALDADLDRVLPDLNRVYDIAFPTTAYRLDPGHRLRLSMAASYWPLVWPTPRDPRITLHNGTLNLPSQPSTPSDPPPAALDLPEKPSWTQLEEAELTRHPPNANGADLISGWTQPMARLHHADIDTVIGYATQASFRLPSFDPARAEASHHHRTQYARPDGTADIDSRATVRAERDLLRVDGALTVSWNGDVVCHKVWDASGQTTRNP